MKIERCEKESFVVIGKEGSSLDGAGFIQKLWDEANSHFEEVQHLAKKDENGNIGGIWGAMSDFSHSFNPWEDFNKGLYLAGVECSDDAEAPNGWTKWIIPGYEYIYVECESDDTFSKAIKYLEDNAIPLVGAVHDFTCPQTGKNYMFFPIQSDPINSDLSNQSSETLVFSRKISNLILVPYVFSLVFALMSRNKGNFLCSADYLIQ